MSEYYKKLAKIVGLIGQDVIDLAEEIAGCEDYISGLKITINFDQEQKRSFPEIFVEKSYFPNTDEASRILYPNGEI